MRIRRTFRSNTTRASGSLLLATICCITSLAQTSRATECWTLRKHGHQQEMHTCFESLVRSNEPYLRAEGYWGLESYDQANEEFRIATARPQSSAHDRVRWGMLLHERFNNSEAVDLFKE